MSKSLLFVDDSATMQTVAEITFRHSDWEFSGARSAGEARSSAAGKSLILVDAVMPDGSGYDLAKELGAANSGATVVMVCGNSEVYNEAKGSAAGCAGHIIKPWQTDKIVEQLAEIASSGPNAPVAAASAPVLTPPSALGTVAKAKFDSAPTPPRSATLMGMPTLEMPPIKPLPAGVAAIKTTKPAIPDLKPAALRTPPPPPAAPIAAPLTPPPPAAPVAAPVASKAAPATRAPMISQKPGKPIRLVLASQAEAAAKQSARAGGLDEAQGDALSNVSRELLEKIIWEVVPDLAEAIIRDNLETLTAKAR